MLDALEPHCRSVVRAVLDGRVVRCSAPARTSCGRPPNTAWERDRYLPSGAELASYLAGAVRLSRRASGRDLVRVSQYAYVMTGSGPLYDAAARALRRDYAIRPLHRLLAALPARLREAAGHARFR